MAAAKPIQKPRGSHGFFVNTSTITMAIKNTLTWAKPKVSRTGSKATTNGRIAKATMRVRPTPQPETACRSTITQHHHSSTTVATMNTKLLTHSGNGTKAEKTIADIGG